MGMFDWVDICCPSCGGLVRFQSKAGPCILDVYDEMSITASIGEDLNGEIKPCEDCGAEVQFIAKTMCVVTPRTVKIKED